MTRQITVSWHPGRFQSNFNAKRLLDYLNFLGRYWDINFVWANGNGRIRFTLENINPGWAAVTRGFDCRISASKNWADQGQQFLDMLCAKVACHEFGHMVRQGNIHSSTPGLMDTNASMPTGNLVPADYAWFNAYSRKPGAKQPHEEPNAMRRALIPGFQSTVEFHSAFELDGTLQFGCQHLPAKRPWYDLRPESWVRP